jgi:GH24 family phage-related lysozyme (muramidase)
VESSPLDLTIDDLSRGAARFARSAATVAPAILDTPRIVTDPLMQNVVEPLARYSGAEGIADWAKSAHEAPYFMERAKDAFDAATDNEYQPRDIWEQGSDLITDLGLSFLTPAVYQKIGQTGVNLVQKLASNPTIRAFAMDQTGSAGGRINNNLMSRAEKLIYKKLLSKGMTHDEIVVAVKGAGGKGSGGVRLTLPESTEQKTLLTLEKQLRENPGKAGEILSEFTTKRQMENIPAALKATTKQIGKVTAPQAAGKKVSKAAGKVIDKAVELRRTLSKPFYEAAYKNNIGDDAIQAARVNPIIDDALNNIMKDPVYKSALGNKGVDSIEGYHVAKIKLYDAQQAALRGGEKNKARLIKDAQKQLNNIIEDASPAFKQANQVFASNSPRVDKLNESVVGVMESLKAKDYGKAADKLSKFSEQEIRYARRTVGKIDPDGWSSLAASYLDDIARGVNYSPAKMLNKLSSKGIAGSVTKEARFNAMLTKDQIAAKERFFGDLQKASRLKGGSPTASNQAANQMLRDELVPLPDVRGSSTLRATDKAIDSLNWVSNKLLEKRNAELANLFIGRGNDDFIKKLVATKPGSPAAYEAIANRIAEVSSVSQKLAPATILSAESSLGTKAKLPITPIAKPPAPTPKINREMILKEIERRKATQPATSLPPGASMTQQNEGIRLSTYRDTEGNPTVGYGFNFNSGIASKVWRDAGLDKDMAAVKQGREALSQDEALKLFQASYKIAQNDAKAYYPEFDDLSPAQQSALMDMSYQMGLPNLQKFKKLKAALRKGNKNAIVESIRTSEYGKKFKDRAQKVVTALLDEKSTTQDLSPYEQTYLKSMGLL